MTAGEEKHRFSKMPALTKVLIEHNLKLTKGVIDLSGVLIAVGRADCPRFDRPAGQRANLHRSAPRRVCE
jgi:hypothetical protein